MGGPNEFGNLLRPLPGNSHSIGKCPARRAAGDETAIVNVRLFLALERRAHRRIYAEVARSARHWASSDTTSSGVRIITDRSQDACSSRALSRLPPVFAASV